MDNTLRIPYVRIGFLKLYLALLPVFRKVKNFELNCFERLTFLDPFYFGKGFKLEKEVDRSIDVMHSELFRLPFACLAVIYLVKRKEVNQPTCSELKPVLTPIWLDRVNVRLLPGFRNVCQTRSPQLWLVHVFIWKHTSFRLTWDMVRCWLASYKIG